MRPLAILRQKCHRQMKAVNCKEQPNARGEDELRLRYHVDMLIQFLALPAALLLLFLACYFASATAFDIACQFLSRTPKTLWLAGGVVAALMFVAGIVFAVIRTR
jgi:hypothetical protein